MTSMRGSIVVATSALVLGCASSNGDTAPSLYGNWIYASAGGTSGVALTVGRDGTYVLSSLALTSPTSAEAQVERGTYTAMGSTIVTTPTEWSCPGPDPVTTLTYRFVGADLELVLPTGILTLAPNTASASTMFAISFGCFTGGSFVPAPLAPVSN